MNPILLVVIFSIVIIVAVIIVFILFLVKGAKGARDDRNLYEKGLISKEQYESGYNKASKDVLNEAYQNMRKK